MQVSVQNWVQKALSTPAKTINLTFVKEIADAIDVSLDGPASFTVQRDEPIELVGRVEVLQVFEYHI